MEPDQIGALLRAHEQVVWLDLRDPSPREFEFLRREFGFHPLALEDAQKRHQRPKIDEYPNFYFLVFYALCVRSPGEAGAGSLVCLEEIGIFLGQSYIVTVHAQSVPELEEAARRWRQVREEVGAHTGTLLYAILDSIVDHYFVVVDALAERMDDLEEQIFERFDIRPSEEIFRLRKELLGVRRVLAPEREVVNTLLRREVPILPPQVTVYLQDVYDHVVRVTDTVDTYRDLLSGTLDAYLSAVSNSLNQVMKTLTAVAAILMSVSLIAAIYGMNFRSMPELEQPWGYPFALGLMAVVGLGLALYFWRRGWL
ncbi:MAG: magnesium/cobalt transporter CorA [Chloroflexi bacterium]|nr:magnesium/cobalt transporter CorA [Chloroflexota bacterium]